MSHLSDGRLAVHSVYLIGGDVSPLSQSPASRQPTAPALSHGAAAAGLKGTLYAIKEASAELHVYAARDCNEHIARFLQEPGGANSEPRWRGFRHKMSSR